MTVQTPPLQRLVLPNGLTLLATENPVADIVSARIFIRAGSRYETPAQAGLFSLMMSVLTKGTEDLSSFDIAEAVETIGASLSSDTSSDYSLISLKTVSADFPAMLKLAGELLRRPSFPESEVALEQRLTLQHIRSMQEQPFTVAFNQLRQLMYGEAHPYALPGVGTEASVSQLDREQLRMAHRQYFRPDEVVVSIAGRIPVDTAVSLVTSVFGDWCAPAERVPPPSLATVDPTGGQALVPQDTHQAIIMTAHLAPAVDHAAYAPLKLLSTYLGNGLSSRLFVELREKRGLAYDVSAFYPTRLGQAQFVAYMGTAPENATTALVGLRHEIRRLAEAPLADEDLQAAKNKLLGQYALGKQTNAQIAQLMGWYEILGLGLAFDQEFQRAVAAVSAAAAQAAAQEFFQADYVTLLGPKEDIYRAMAPSA